MADNDQLVIPGTEGFFEEDNGDEVSSSGAAQQGEWFDAFLLPDAAERQRVAHGNQTYLLYIVCETQEDMIDCLRVLSGGNRKGVAKNAKLTTLNSLALLKGTSTRLMDWWKEKLVVLPKEKTP